LTTSIGFDATAPAKPATPLALKKLDINFNLILSSAMKSMRSQMGEQHDFVQVSNHVTWLIRAYHQSTLA